MADDLQPTKRTAKKQTAYTSGAKVWVPDEDKVFVSGVAKEQSKTTGEVTVLIDEDQSERKFKLEQILPVNPPALSKVSDMAKLSHLNQPSVLHNIKERYADDDIYTYSGLFLVAVNPYKKLPIYNPEYVEKYQGKRRDDLPPHVFSLADLAYRQMLQNKQNQSMLVTGESGAGKTENTKKVIQYLAAVAGAESGSGKLEKQLLLTNPLLEAFGNAKTIRNNNSSRFGKFIEINFNAAGYIAGCRIQNYLLESTRVVSQNPDERNFHFFYQLVSDPECRKKFQLPEYDNIEYLNQSGCTVVKGIDDKKEFKDTMKAMDIIGINEEERHQICSIIAGLLHLGNVQFGKDKKEKATILDTFSLNMAAQLFGVNEEALGKSIISPVITAGSEKVVTHVDIDGAVANRNAITKSIYNRLFDWLVKRINESLSARDSIKNFIGVLDIAGFEIFDVNSFEQLCINYTNEKLQQFFNHHMFKKEQEEYMREQIEWKFEDFGLDLQPTIDLIEKPLGVMSLLDQHTFMQGSNDKKLSHDIIKNHKSKVNIFHTSKFDETIFSVVHYAGEVTYTTKSWLHKNEDPLNEDSKTTLKDSSFHIMRDLFNVTEEKSSKKGSGARFMTVADKYKRQLKSLMSVLASTDPHFIRCIVPNSLQRPGIIDPKLILHQLRCNGVLEGIRISRKGFPGRIIVKEFLKRYSLLGKKSELAKQPSPKDKCRVILDSAGLVEGKHFKIGLTKVFLKSGVEAMIEELRERRIAQIVVIAQAAIRGRISRKHYHSIKEKIIAVRLIQRNWRSFHTLRDWSWWHIFQAARPHISSWKDDQRKKEQLDEMERLKRKRDEEEKERKALEEEKQQLEEEIARIQTDIDAEKQKQDDLTNKINTLQNSTTEYERLLEDTNKEKKESDDEKGKLQNVITDKDFKIKARDEEIFALNEKLKAINRDIESMKKNLGSKDSEVSDLFARVQKLEEELAQWKEKYSKEQQKGLEYERIKAQLEETIRDLNFSLETAAKQKNEAENKFKSLDDELKQRKNEANDLEDNIVTLGDEMNKIKIQLSTKTDELKSKAKTLDELELEKNRVSNEINSVNERFNEEQRKRTRLENDLRHIKEDKAEVENTYNRLINEKSVLEESISKCGVEYSEWKTKYTTLQELNMQLEAKKSNLEGVLRELDLKTSEEKQINKQQIERLQQKLEEQGQELNNQLAQLQNQASAAERNAKSSEKKVRDLERNIEDLNKLREDLDQRAKQLEANMTDLDNQLNAEKKRVNDLETSKRTLENDHKNIVLKIDALKEDLGRSEARSRKTISDLTEALERLDNLGKDKTSLSSKSGDADKLTRDLKTELAELRTLISQLQGERDQLSNEVRLISSKVLSLEDQETSLDNFIKMKTDEINGLNAELDTEKHGLKREDTKVSQLESRLKTSGDRLAEEESRLQSMEQAISEAEAKLRELDVTGSAAKGANDDLALKVTTAERQLQQLNNEFSEATNQINKLRGEKTELSLAKEDAQNKLADLEVTLKTNSQTLSELQNQQRETQSKFETEKQSRISQEQEIIRLKSEVDRKKDDLTTEMLKNKAQLDKMRQQRDMNQVNQERQLKKFQEERSDLKRQLKHKKAQVKNQEDSGVDEEALEAIKRENEVHISKLQAQVTEQTNLRAELEYKKKEIDLQLQDLKERVDNEERQRKKIESQYKALQLEYDELRELAEDADTLREDIDRIRLETQTMMNILKADTEKEHKKLSESEELTNKLQMENQQLKLDIEAEKKKETENMERLKQQQGNEINDHENLLNKLKRDKLSYGKIAKKLERENRELTRKLAMGGQFKLDNDSKLSEQDREISKLKMDLSFQSKNAIKMEGENQKYTRELQDFKEKSNRLEDELQALREALMKEKKRASAIQRSQQMALRLDDEDDDDDFF